MVCLRRRSCAWKRGKANADCREVWISGNNVEFRDTGFERVLQAKRG